MNKRSILVAAFCASMALANAEGTINVTVSRQNIAPGETAEVVVSMTNDKENEVRGLGFKFDIPAGLSVVEGSVEYNKDRFPTDWDAILNIKDGACKVDFQSLTEYVSGTEGWLFKFKVKAADNYASDKNFTINAEVSYGGFSSEKRNVTASFPLSNPYLIGKAGDLEIASAATVDGKTYEYPETEVQITLDNRWLAAGAMMFDVILPEGMEFVMVPGKDKVDWSYSDRVSPNINALESKLSSNGRRLALVEKTGQTLVTKGEGTVVSFRVKGSMKLDYESKILIQNVQCSTIESKQYDKDVKDFVHEISIDVKNTLRTIEEARVADNDAAYAAQVEALEDQKTLLEKKLNEIETAYLTAKFLIEEKAKEVGDKIDQLLTEAKTNFDNVEPFQSGPYTPVEFSKDELNSAIEQDIYQAAKKEVDRQDANQAAYKVDLSAIESLKGEVMKAIQSIPEEYEDAGANAALLDKVDALKTAAGKALAKVAPTNLGTYAPVATEEAAADVRADIKNLVEAAEDEGYAVDKLNIDNLSEKLTAITNTIKADYGQFRVEEDEAAVANKIVELLTAAQAALDAALQNEKVYDYNAVATPAVIAAIEAEIDQLLDDAKDRLDAYTDSEQAKNYNVLATDNGAWENKGLGGIKIGGDDVNVANVDLQTVVVDIPVASTGYMVNTIEKLGAGLYTYTIGKVENALVQIVQDGEVLATNVVEGELVKTIEFYAGDNEKVEIRVSSYDGSNGFKFGKAKLTFYCDFEAIAKASTAAMNDYAFALAELTPQEDAVASIAYKALKAEETTLAKDKEDLEAAIAEIEGATKETAYAIWKKYNLGTLKNPRVATEENEIPIPDVADLVYAYETHNANVAVENARFAQQEFNKAALANSITEADLLNTSIAGVLAEAKALAAAEKEVDGISVANNDYPLSVLEGGEGAEAIKQLAESVEKYKKLLAGEDFLGGDKNLEEDAENFERANNALQQITNECEGIIALYNIAKADAKAYTDLQKNSEDLTDKYDKAYNFIMGVKHIVGTEYINKIAEIYEPAKAALEQAIKDQVKIEGSEALDEVNTKTYKDALDAINEIYNKVKELVGNDAEQYTAATTAIDEVTTALNAAKESLNDVLGEDGKVTVAGVKDADVKAKLEADAATIEQAIADLTAVVEAQHASYDLSEGEWKDAADQIASNIETLNTTIATAKQLDGYTDALAAAKKAIEAEQVTLAAAKKAIEAEQVTGYEFVEKYAKSYNSIAEAIQLAKDNIVNDVRNVLDQTEVDYIVNGTTEYQTLGVETGKYIKAQADVVAAQKTTAEALTDYISASQNSDVKLGFDKADCDLEAWQTKANNLQTEVNTNDANLKKVIADNEGDALYHAVQAYAVPAVAGLDAANAEFAHEFTVANKKVLDNKYEGQLAALNKDDAATTYGPGLPGLKDELAKLKEQIDALVIPAAGSPVTDYRNAEATPAVNIDMAIVDLYKEVLMEKSLKAAEDNVKNNAALAALLAGIDYHEEWVKANTMDPATSYYLGLINGAGGMAGYKTQVAAIATEINEKYEANALDDDTTKAFKAQLQAMQDLADQTWQEAKDNEAAHTALMTLSQEKTKNVQDAIELIENNYDGSVVVKVTLPNDVEFEGTVEEVKDNLEALKETLTGINNDVYATYGVGENRIAENKNAYTERYNAVQAIVDAYLLGVNGDYLNGIIAANNAVCAAVWAPELENLEDAFKTAVEFYEVLISSNKNVGYHEALMAAFTEDHADRIYEFSAKITDLKEEVANLLKSAYLNEDGTLKAQEDMKVQGHGDYTMILAAAKEYLTQMNAYTNQILNDAQATAEKYYGNAKAAAEAVIAQAVDEMTAAGIDEAVIENAIKEAKNNIALADTWVWTCTDATPLIDEAFANSLPKLLVHLDDILALVESITSIDTEAAADIYWNNRTKAADLAMVNAETTFWTVDADGNDVLISYLEDLYAAFVGVKQEYDNLKAKGEDCTIRPNSEAYVANLTWKLDQIEAAVSELTAQAEQRIQNNQANIDIHNTCLETIPVLEAEYREMQTTISALDLTIEQFEDINTPVIGKQIEGLKNALNAFDYTLAASVNEENFTALIATISENMAEAYQTAYAAELQNLETLIHDVKYAYDLVKAAGETEPEVLEAWNAEIDRLAVVVAANTIAEDAESTLSLGDRATLLNNLAQAEKDIEALYQEIDPTWSKTSNNADADFKAELGVQYAEVEAVLAAAAATVAEAAEYGIDNTAELDALNAKLAQIKADWENDHQLVITYSEYQKRMSDLVAETGTFVDGVENAIKQAQLEIANEALFAKLEGVINDYAAKVKNVAAAIDEYEFVNRYTYEEAFQRIEEWYFIPQRAELERLKDAVLLVKWEGDEIVNNHELSDFIEEVDKFVDAVDAMALQDEINHQKAEADKATRRLTYAIQAFVEDGYTFADLEGIENGIDLLKEVAKKLAEAEATHEMYEDIKYTSHEIIEYIVGDVDVENSLMWYIDQMKVKRGDVSLDGRISVLDYNKLLRMILTKDNAYDQGEKVKVAADVNGNERIDVADIASLVNIITGKNVAQAPAKAKAVSGANELALSLEAENNGVRRLAVNLNNATALVSAQMDIVLPEGLSVVNAVATSRIEGLQLHTNDLGDGLFRVVIASPENNAIVAGDGALFYLDIEGSASSNITVTEAIGADVNAIAHELSSQNATATGINSISDAVIAGAKKIYNVGGQMIDSMKNGINILVGKDGKAKKVLK